MRAWMTVRMSSMGRGLCSISCCITTASTSEVYTLRSAKHRLVAASDKEEASPSPPGLPAGGVTPRPAAPTLDDGLHVALGGVDVVQGDQQLPRVQRGHGRGAVTCRGTALRWPRPSGGRGGDRVQAPGPVSHPMVAPRGEDWPWGHVMSLQPFQGRCRVSPPSPGWPHVPTLSTRTVPRGAPWCPTTPAMAHLPTASTRAVPRDAPRCPMSPQ